MQSSSIEIHSLRYGRIVAPYFCAFRTTLPELRAARTYGDMLRPFEGE